MSIFGDIFTGIRGKANEAGQSIVDANLPTILDQQMRDAQKEIDNATHSLQSVMATFSIESDKLKALQSKVAEYNTNIQTCLNKGNEDLAREVATKLAPLETQVTAQQALVTNLNDQVGKLKLNLHKAEDALSQIKSQADVAKAQLSVNKARQATTASVAGSNSALSSAAESLQRMNDRATRASAEMDAADKLNAEKTGDDLDAKLRAAGVISGGDASVDDIMSRFKKSDDAK